MEWDGVDDVGLDDNGFERFPHRMQGGMPWEDAPHPAADESEMESRFPFSALAGSRSPFSFPRPQLPQRVQQRSWRSDFPRLFVPIQSTAFHPAGGGTVMERTRFEEEEERGSHLFPRSFHNPAR
uniref:Uncharacterized protein n=1 Tax=Palpitomonas bilix TaxID=652834 RepID=A0A7S3DK30_9EUKA|mmetsp:Transcript_40621/g.105447  ORF Transcript_40621/g.105447 Transcript_40621/m.105447 type:complete len:125 (+) Transcript_40621:446-820(+)